MSVNNTKKLRNNRFILFITPLSHEIHRSTETFRYNACRDYSRNYQFYLKVCTSQLPLSRYKLLQSSVTLTDCNLLKFCVFKTRVLKFLYFSYSKCLYAVFVSMVGILVGKPERKIPLGKLNCREDNIKVDLQEVGWWYAPD